MHKSKLIVKLQPVIFAGIIFCILIFSSLWFTNYKKGIWEKDIRNRVLQMLTGKKSNLEKALHSRIYYTRGVAAYVGLNPNISNQEFAELAQEYIQNDSVISTMALSRNCIINAIYPYQGHEAAIGLDLLAHPERKDIVEQTIKTHQTFIAGPVELVEGGIAFISYTPIFDKTKSDMNNFWGVTDIVIKKSELINESKLKLTEDGFNFALRGYNGTGNMGDVFWGDAEIFNQSPVTLQIELPIGSWILAAAPENGWNKFHDQDKTLAASLFLSAFIISLLLGLFIRSILKLRIREKELKAVFQSLDSLIIELDRNGEYLKVNSKTNLLFLPEKEIKGKKLHDIFEKEKADYFLDAVQRCLKTKQLVLIEYPLTINGKDYWFLARLTVKSENSVIYNAFDITQQKLQEEKLKDSEKALIELNNEKDKFFSIIAHDLKGPLGSLKNLIELMYKQFDEFDKSTLKNLISGLKKSADHLHNLMNNLLEWSLSQSGKLEVNLISFNIKELCMNVAEQFAEEAAKKEIVIQNNAADLKISADKNLTETIIRNLISNAIKFTGPGGKINLESSVQTSNERKFLHLTVTDTGIGMDKETIENIFKLNRNTISLGTAGEKGTGLGLLLCKEFAEKQGGSIQVQSKKNKGSSFTLLIPSEN